MAAMSRIGWAVLVAFLAVGDVVVAAEPSTSAAPSAAAGSGVVPDILEAEEQQLVGIKCIPNSSKSAQIIVTNKTKRPLTLRLPSAFTGVPVLGQVQVGGVAINVQQPQQQQGGFGSQGIGGGGGQARTPQNPGGMGGAGAGGGGLFSIPPERTLVFRVPTVCLEYGKREPSTRIPYKLCPVTAMSEDPRVAVLLEWLGTGELPQRVAQAAAWHVANGLSWERLAAERIDHAGGIPDEPYFSPADLVAAHQVVTMVTEEARRRTASSAISSATGSPVQ